MSGYPIKMVRDAVPTVVNPSGEPGDLFYDLLPAGEDRGPWLRRKLHEEAAEYCEDRGLDELVQVLQVVEALAADQHGVSLGHLIKKAREEPRGAYLSGMMMYGHHAETD